MPMRAPTRGTGTYSGSAKAAHAKATHAKATHANKSGFGFVEVYMQAKCSVLPGMCGQHKLWSLLREETVPAVRCADQTAISSVY